MNSASAWNLQQELRDRLLVCKRVKQEGNYKPKKGDLIVNWGNTHVPTWNPYYSGEMLNGISEVNTAINKLVTFAYLSAANVSIPEFTFDKSTAQNWNSACVVRHVLNGREGKGIEIVERGQPPPDAPLYTKYVKKSKEYRIHIFGGKVIDILEKRKKGGWEDERDTRIRNLRNGYVFCREGINISDDVLVQAIKAVDALGLDFGGVDIIWNNYYNKAFVLEVNTAPGIEGQTVIHFADAIEGIFKND